jgi:DNA-directed RNA polymerase subunit RPC12/RpoP
MVAYKDEWLRTRVKAESGGVLANPKKKGRAISEAKLGEIKARVRSWARLLADPRYRPGEVFEWEILGDTPAGAKARAEEIVRGSEPTRAECIRRDAYTMTGFAFDGENMECGHCGREMTHRAGAIVCQDCMRKAGVPLRSPIMRQFMAGSL